MPLWTFIYTCKQGHSHKVGPYAGPTAAAAAKLIPEEVLRSTYPNRQITPVEGAL